MYGLYLYFESFSQFFVEPYFAAKQASSILHIWKPNLKLLLMLSLTSS